MTSLDAAESPLRILLLLRSSDPEGLCAAVRAMAAERPEERRYVDPERLASLYGAVPEAAGKVEAFAAQHGLKVAGTYRECRLVALEGTAERFAQAFSTSFETVHRGQRQHRRPVGTTTLPAELADLVEGVFGLDDLPLFTPGPRLPGVHPPAPGTTQTDGAPPAASGSLPAAQPADVLRRYRFPEEATGAGQTIAILLLGGGFYEEDVRAYFGEKMPSLRVVEVGGAKNDPAPRKEVRKFFEEIESGQAPSAEGELRDQIMWTLEATVDVELAGSFAPGADLVVYFAPNEERGKLEGLTAILTDRESRPSVLSCSWGLSEADAAKPFVEALEQLFELAALAGLSVCYSSGDHGPNAQGGQPTVNYPASSPHVLGCGGTTLWPVSMDKPEHAWREKLGTTVLATGGGYSRFFPRPDWQPLVGDATPDGAGRGVPDVAGKADFYNAYEIFLAGRSWALGGGTSSAAPMWAALLARFNQALRHRVGWLTPLLYRPDLARCQQDIAHGGNGLFPATPGWDAATGWGTPDGEALLAALRSG